MSSQEEEARAKVMHMRVGHMPSRDHGITIGLGPDWQIKLRPDHPWLKRSQEVLQPGWFSMKKIPEHGEPGHQSGPCGKCNSKD